MEAERILDEDHSGLEKVKARILEHLAVMRRLQKILPKPAMAMPPTPAARPDPVPGGPPRRGQDLAWPVASPGP